MFSFVPKKDLQWLLGYVKYNKMINDKEEPGQSDKLQAEVKPVNM